MNDQRPEGKNVPCSTLLDEHQVRELVDAMLITSYQKDVAADLGVSAAYLNDYLHFRREPGAKLLDGLGLQRVTLYRRLPSNASGER